MVRVVSLARGGIWHHQKVNLGSNDGGLEATRPGEPIKQFRGMTVNIGMYVYWISGTIVMTIAQ
jgi:hypothetical protein